MDGIGLIVLCGVAALALSYWVGYTQGKDAANRTTYAALNTLVDSWNLLINRMKPEDRGPTLSRIQKTSAPAHTKKAVASNLVSQ